MKSLCIIATMGGLVLVAGQSRGADPAPAAAGIQPAASDFVTIYGQVEHQGRYELNPKVKMNVDEAVLLLAGGATESANLRKVKLIRVLQGGPAKSIIFTPVKSAICINLGACPNIPIVKPGDVIFVPKRVNWR